MAGKPVRKTRYTCPACGKVSLFTTGQVMQCKSCGHYATDDEPLVPVPAFETLPPTPPQPARREDAPTGLAIGALVCGLAAAAGLWVFPVALLLAIAAIALGAVALSQNEPDDAGVQVMSIIGIVAGGLVLLFAFVLWPFFIYDDGGSSYTYYDGGSSTTVENDSGSSGGGGSGSSSGGTQSSGSGGGGGGSSGAGGGSGGGGGGGGGGSPSVGAPAPAGLLVGAGLVGLAAWRRRA
ncbi:MAG: hypothetical protein QOC71_793 [Thermoplasmata archaeon]|jgi:hypothetical protein|nr:hypothetical protein [Thermoplasmata archaeon]